MKRSLACLLVCVVSIVSYGSGVPFAQPVLKLKNSFIDQLKNRATLSTQFTIDAVTERHDQDKDGDLHIIGRSSDVGLRVIAEIKNALSFGPAEDLAIASVTHTLPVTGVWRLWFEHPETQSDMVQFADVSVGTSLNQKHVFELHPLLRIGTEDLKASVGFVNGYLPYTSAYAFFRDPSKSYATGSIKVKRDATWTTLKCNTKAFNHVLLEAKLVSKAPLAGGDGTAATVTVMIGTQNLTMRVITASGTKADIAINALTANKRFSLLAIPRVKLSWIATLPKDGVERTFLLSGKVADFVEFIGLHVQKPD
ncbi:MAG: hypothetical protein HZC36_01730 [Armatimonadetes bacterium]|nr:hypothetical protein [Armatimonadota bacterium]